ncbi:hypothetical protein [Pontibacter virosus]|uniref:Uncharacterized protein n=1 Tax=Pontibacter virosus TaxID=1765052 RepID=A0A2U1ALT3_9BACT|nr:hypothetical protein [Pontibacter virosus]PVY37261.1 hypothetical protein C8E01_12245 [Pontibacter virosus]
MNPKDSPYPLLFKTSYRRFSATQCSFNPCSAKGIGCTNPLVIIMHKEYLDNFNQIGTPILKIVQLDIRTELIDGDGCGVTKIGLYKNGCKKYEIKYAYNHLDFNLGVSVFEVLHGKADYQRPLLPKHFSGGLNSYGYSESEIENLVKDICDLEKKISTKPKMH